MKILFVCKGNICGSPTAEGVFAKILADIEPELDVEVDSAGTHAYHVGHEPDRRAQAAAIQRGIDLSRLRARKVASRDFEYFTHILAMDEDNLRLLHEWCPPEFRGRVRLFLDYAPEAEVRNVPDPYYGSSNGFEYVLDLVEEASRGLIEELRRQAHSA